jgi:hypothetical protein
MRSRKSAVRIGIGIVLLVGLCFAYYRLDKSGWLAKPDFEAELASLSTGSTLPDSTMTQMNVKARAAISKGDYQLGLKIVDALSRVNGMSPEQAVSLRNTVQTMKMQMAEAALGGDTNAEKAIAQFKATSVLGR